MIAPFSHRGHPSRRYANLFNQHRHQSPDERRKVLHMNDPEVDEFGADGGLVIDTVTLFEWARGIDAGSSTSHDARAALGESVGRLDLPKESQGD